MALKLTVKIEGLDKIRRKFDRLGPAGSAAVRSAIYVVANDLMLKSIYLTPKDDGWLRNTWYCSKPYKHIGFSECGYGASYAHNAHEMPSTVNWSEPGTGSKFLQKPFLEMKPTLAREINEIAKRKFNVNKKAGHFPGKIPASPETGDKPDSWKKKKKK